MLKPHEAPHMLPREPRPRKTGVPSRAGLDRVFQRPYSGYQAAPFTLAGPRFEQESFLWSSVDVGS